MALVTKRKSVSASEEATTDSVEAAAPAAPAVESVSAEPFVATPPVFDAATMPADAAVGDAASAAPVPAGDDVAELRSSLNDLQALVATLMAKADQPDTGARDPLARDSDTASRIIVAANHAADATLEGARAEAEDLITTAKAKSFEIIGVARELADQELAAERERVARATAEWATTRTEITERLVALESSMGGYQSDLAAATAVVRAAIEQLRLTPDDSPVAAVGTGEADAPAASGVVVDDATDVGAVPAAEPASADDSEEIAAEDAASDAPRRSNLFGGDAASRRAAGAPVLPGALTNGAATNGAATNGAPANGAADPGRLRAGFFGR